MNRRSFIAAAAIVPLAGSVGAGGLEPESEIAGLYRQWKVAELVYQAETSEDEAVQQAHYNVINGIEDRILELPSRSLSDMAVKVKIDCDMRESQDVFAVSLYKDASRILAA